MNYIFNQPRGLGDILFIMQIAQEEVAKGNRVIIPVDSHYTDIQKHFPEVEIVDKSKYKIEETLHVGNFIQNDTLFLVIPFRFANDILSVPYTECMKAKYWLWDVLNEATGTSSLYSWKRWCNFTFVRDTENEEKLLAYLNPSGKPFNIINRNFRTNFTGKSQIKVDNGLLNVEMRYIKGFTLLDWALVLERASNIFTVGTSINYLIEKLEIDVPINLYCRKPEEHDFKNYDYILDTEKKNYIFHY